ncbi:hypothetical protein F4808DRAFT_236341 [Astrocystis sublimbata]|nr:hypothetical protein F4808DRAFT_236341 [Astrocystis sublimbata]
MHRHRHRRKRRRRCRCGCNRRAARRKGVEAVSFWTARYGVELLMLLLLLLLMLRQLGVCWLVVTGVGVRERRQGLLDVDVDVGCGMSRLDGGRACRIRARGGLRTIATGEMQGARCQLLVIGKCELQPVPCALCLVTCKIGWIIRTGCGDTRNKDGGFGSGQCLTCR